MSQHHRQLAQRWFEDVWNRRIDASIDELLHPDARGHMEGFETKGVEEFRNVRATFLEAFPDFRLDVEDMVVDGDNVVTRWRVRGSHLGNSLGMAATQRSADFRGMTWLRFENGRIVEGWDSWNMGDLMQKLTV